MGARNGWMRCKLTSVALTVSLVIALGSPGAYAKNTFSGLYAQISTGYENNYLGDPTGSTVEVPNTGDDVLSFGSSENFGGAPLVLGMGYYWQVFPSWLLGVGANYSALSQTTSPMSYNITNAPGNFAIANGTTATASGQTVELSDRFDFFVSPAYQIDKEKLVYLKAGYSQVSFDRSDFTSFSATANGSTFATPVSGGPNHSSDHGGFLLGLGYKQIITKGLYGFFEGNYMRYSEPNYSWTRAQNRIGHLAGGIITTIRTTNNLDFSELDVCQFLIGVGYSF